MRMIFPQTKSTTSECSTCGQLTHHEKAGTNHDLHILITFFTFFLWTPVWIVATLVERSHQFECRECLPAPAPENVTQQAHPMTGV